MANNTMNVEIETGKIKGFDLHYVRYFDMTECKYVGDGAEKLIEKYETYNPVIPYVGCYVWVENERYTVKSIDYSPNEKENENDVMIEIGLVESPLQDIDEEDYYNCDNLCCKCNKVKDECAETKKGTLIDDIMKNINSVNIYI